MGLKGQHSGHSTGLLGPCDRSSDHRLVTDVHPVKDSQRKMQRPLKRFQIRNGR
jgi:hypothetical protein